MGPARQSARRFRGTIVVFPGGLSAPWDYVASERTADTGRAEAKSDHVGQ